MPCEDMQTTGRDTTNTAHYPSRTPLLPILRSHTVLMCMHMRLRRRRLLQWRRLRRRPLSGQSADKTCTGMTTTTPPTNPTNLTNKHNRQLSCAHPCGSHRRQWQLKDREKTLVLRPPMWVAQAPMTGLPVMAAQRQTAVRANQIGAREVV